ncbi:MAG: hypothetical protein SFU98_19435 [Leptospiraceae bacterium]|nr:hypothetical protein [Leptospiraceae bacterium]
MLKKTPFLRRQIFAVILLLICSFGVLFLLLSFHGTIFGSKLALIVLQHGFEGGLVGGLCDWFAVWKTYNSIEKESAVVSDEIGKWVATDLLNQQTLQSQLDTILNSQETQVEIVHILETYFETQEKTKEILDGLWSKVEDPVTNFIRDYNFSQAELNLISDTAQDKIILDTVKICVGDTLLHISDEIRFKDMLNQFIQEQNLVTRFLSNFIDIPEIIRAYGRKLKSGEELRTSEEKYIDEVVTLISISADKYILSWQNLAKERKTEAVKALLFKLKEEFGTVFAKFIIEHKNNLKARKTLGEYKPVKAVFDLIGSKIDQNISNYIGDRIATRLKSQDPKDLREKLEWQTRNVLENIRINGTILGFFLGMLVGILKFYYTGD